MEDDFDLIRLVKRDQHAQPRFLFDSDGKVFELKALEVSVKEMPDGTVDELAVGFYEAVEPPASGLS